MLEPHSLPLSMPGAISCGCGSILEYRMEHYIWSFISDNFHFMCSRFIHFASCLPFYFQIILHFYRQTISSLPLIIGTVKSAALPLTVRGTPRVFTSALLELGHWRVQARFLWACLSRWTSVFCHCSPLLLLSWPSVHSRSSSFGAG